ncbi:hypothetical protein LTR94_034249, partial [Friedmanniomyces endolithicus]
DGSDLPAWLAFDGNRFTGTTPANFNGSLAINLTASDGLASVSTGFALVIAPVNDAPVVAAPLGDATATIGSPIAIAVPQGTFADVDGDPLSLSATLDDGTALPAWLSFANGVLTGTAPAGSAGSYAIRITANDGQAT